MASALSSLRGAKKTEWIPGRDRPLEVTRSHVLSSLQDHWQRYYSLRRAAVRFRIQQRRALNNAVTSFEGVAAH